MKVARAHTTSGFPGRSNAVLRLLTCLALFFAFLFATASPASAGVSELGPGGRLINHYYLENASATAGSQRAYILLMQGDGNLVLYRFRWCWRGSYWQRCDHVSLWASGTGGNPGSWVTMQHDGNLVVYSPDNNRPLWASNTVGGRWGSTYLKVQDDGNVVLYRDGSAVWATHTAK